MDTLYSDYDDVIIGRQQNLDFNHFYGQDPNYVNERIALKCIRYALEEILQWDEDMAIQRLDEYTLRTMKLTKVLNYIDFPIDVTDGNPKYILSLLYPHKVKVNADRLAATTFKEVLTTKGKQFPRGYFAGYEGFQRYCSCLKYLMENCRSFGSVGEIYEFFNSTQGRQFLAEYRLKVPAEQYDININDALHYLTKHLPDGQLYYEYYMFLEAMAALKKEPANK